MLLDNHEDIERSEPLLDAAAASGVSEVAQLAHLVLGLIALHVENRGRARSEFELAEAGPPQVAAPAIFQLAKMATDDGNLDAAAVLLNRLIHGPFDDDALRRYAAAHLGAVRLRQHNPEAAMELLRWAAASDDADTAAYCLELGTALFEGGDLDAAAEILTAVMNAESPLTNAVRARLGMVRLAQGSAAPASLARPRYEEARQLLTTALNDASPEQVPEIRRYLGTVLARLGRPTDAREVLAPLVGSEDTEHRPHALLLLGRMAVHEDDDPTARRWLSDAVETGNQEVEGDARQELAELQWRAGDITDARRILELPDGEPAGDRRRRQTVLGELEPAEEPRPTEEPGSTEQPRPTEAAAEPAARPALPPLPAAVLSALATLAEIEGDPAEAVFWRSQA
jgi:predicted negative regulator of RcsB-dependent stress response